MAKAASSGRGSRAGVGLAVGALVGLIAADLDLGSLVSFWGDRSYFVLGAALAGGLLWLTPLRRLLGVGAVLAAILWLAVAFTPAMARLADGLVRRDPLESADAVFVFASRLQTTVSPRARR